MLLQCAFQETEGVTSWLLRNIYYFCENRGFEALLDCFERCSPKQLPCDLAADLVFTIANVGGVISYRSSMILRHFLFLS